MKNLPHCVECSTKNTIALDNKDTCVKCGDHTYCVMEPIQQLTDEDMIEIYNNIHFPEKRRVSDVNQITFYESKKRLAEEAIYHHLKSLK